MSLKPSAINCLHVTLRAQRHSLKEVGIDLSEECFHVDSHTWHAEVLVLRKFFLRFI